MVWSVSVRNMKTVSMPSSGVVPIRGSTRRWATMADWLSAEFREPPNTTSCCERPDDFIVWVSAAEWLPFCSSAIHSSRDVHDHDLLWLEVVCSKTESDLFCSGIYILLDCMYCVYHSMHRLLLWVFSCNNLTLIRTKSVCRQCTVLCNTTLNGCLHGQTGVGCTPNKPRCCRRESTWATVTRVWLVALNRCRLWDNS